MDIGLIMVIFLIGVLVGIIVTYVIFNILNRNDREDEEIAEDMYMTYKRKYDDETC